MSFTLKFQENRHKCSTCSYYRERVEGNTGIRICVAYSGESKNRWNTITAPVTECSQYEEKGTMGEYEMRQIAWVLETKKGKPIGFVNPEEFKKKVQSGEMSED